MILDFSNN